MVSPQAVALTWQQHKKQRESAQFFLHLVSSSVDIVHAAAGDARLVGYHKQLPASPFCASQAASIFTGGTYERYQAFNSAVHSIPRGKDAAELFVKMLHGDRDYNWLAGEPRARLEALLREETSQVVFLPVPPMALAELDALAALRDTVYAAGKKVILLAHAESVEEYGAASALADDAVLSDPCDPDPGFSFAWTVESSSAKRFHADGLGKLMMQISIENGRGVVNCSSFVAAQATDRVIWYLAAEGYERAKIANVVCLSVDEIDQRLAVLRPLRKDQVPGAWRKRFNGVFDFTSLDT